MIDGNIDRYLSVPDKHDELVRKSELYRDVKYPVIVTSLPGGEWLTEHLDLPGCKAHGKTPAEAEALLKEVKLSWIYAALADGIKIPGPSQNVRIVTTI